MRANELRARVGGGRVGRVALVAVCTGALIGVSAVSAAQGAVTLGLAPTVIINEVMPANFSGARDENSSYKDWVELYNTTAADVDLAGWGLSNNPKSPFRWVFPAGTTITAGGYLRVWASKADRTASQRDLHTNFNLDNGVDPVLLSAPTTTTLGQLVDSTTPPRLASDTSWCRMPDGVPGGTFSICLAPSEESANGGATAGLLLDTPTIQVPSGVYGSAQSVAVDGPAGAQLRYTVDGSEPTATSPLVTGPIAVPGTRVLRVSAFQTGRLTSDPATATYVIDTSTRWAGQRALFVTMRPSDASRYIGRGSAPSEGWKSHVELLTPTGERAFAAPAVTEDAGQIGSRNGQDVYPMDIIFKDATGAGSVQYPVFTAKPGKDSFDTLRLRNAGDDYQEAHVRDQFWQSVGTEANLAPSASEPVQLFVNGAYLGMMDLREKEDETLIESEYDVDKDNVEFRSDSRVVAGEDTNASFATMYDFITRNDLAVAANYTQAKKLIDVESFAHDFALHMFATDRDWQWRNMHAFRMPDYDGRWRYRPHDFDISSDGTDAFGYSQQNSTNMNDMYTPHDSGDIMLALLDNPQFRKLYANVIADQLNSVLSPEELSARLDTFTDPMAAYLPNQIAKNSDPSSMAKWTSEVGILRNFFTARRPHYIAHTRDYLGLGAPAPVTVQTSDPAMGTVKVNTLDLSTRLTAAAPASWTGSYWTGTPVTLEATPRPGFVFTGWQGSSRSSKRVISVKPTDGKTYRATFAPVATPATPVVTPVRATRTATTGQVVALQINATDPSGYTLEYKDKDLPSGLSIHKKTGLIYGKPTRAGTFASTITVTNGVTSTKLPLSWTVTNQLDRLVALPLGVTGDGPGLTAEYFAAATFAGAPALTRVEAPAVEVGSGSGPVAGFGTSGWGIRWTGSVTVPVSGTYTIAAFVRSDDGVRVSVGGRQLFDAWTSGATAPSGTVDLVANTATPIVVEFQDRSSSASLSMQWQIPGQTTFSPMVQGVFTP